MSIADKLPDLNDKELESLRANAQRLSSAGAPPRQKAALDLLPLIQAEIDARKSRAPVKPVKPAAKSPTKAKPKRKSP
jgi:hypothetical protein